MEWAIPLQKLEVGKIQICELQNNEKSLVPLAYFDGQHTFPFLNILLPKFSVDSFDPLSGKLVISLKDVSGNQSEAKLNALQTCLLNAVFMQQQIWFPSKNYTLDILNKLFKPIVENDLLYLYFPTQYNNDIHIYKDKKWYNKYQPGIIQKNDNVRIMFRIQGLSFHKDNYNKEWSGKFRLQHRILTILVG